VNSKGKNTIPVYDICNLANIMQIQDDIIAEPFAEYLKRHPDLHFPHRHSFYHLVYFTKGGGSHTIDFESFPVKPGQIYFMTPGQVHTWSFDDKVDGYIINFSEDLLHSFLKNGQYPEQFPFFSGLAQDGVIQLKQARAQTEALLRSIVEETNTNDQYSRELIKASLVSLFICIAREITPGAPRPHARQNKLVLQNFRKLVEQHFSSMRLPKEYAAMLYITPNHLNALCNDMLGRPAGEVIRERVLLEAKRLLVSSAIGIAEIAWELQFKDNSYFTKFFKKYTGTTPEEFRSAGIEQH
jgi:AraC family transcriptional activator of pobA